MKTNSLDHIYYTVFTLCLRDKTDMRKLCHQRSFDASKAKHDGKLQQCNIRPQLWPQAFVKWKRVEEMRAAQSVLLNSKFHWINLESNLWVRKSLCMSVIWLGEPSQTKNGKRDFVQTVRPDRPPLPPFIVCWDDVKQKIHLLIFSYASSWWLLLQINNWPRIVCWRCQF